MRFYGIDDDAIRAAMAKGGAAHVYADIETLGFADRGDLRGEILVVRKKLREEVGALVFGKLHGEWVLVSIADDDIDMTIGYHAPVIRVGVTVIFRRVSLRPSEWRIPERADINTVQYTHPEKDAELYMSRLAWGDLLRFCAKALLNKMGVRRK